MTGSVATYLHVGDRVALLVDAAALIRGYAAVLVLVVAVIAEAAVEARRRGDCGGVGQQPQTCLYRTWVGVGHAATHAVHHVHATGLPCNVDYSVRGRRWYTQYTTHPTLKLVIVTLGNVISWHLL